MTALQCEKKPIRPDHMDYGYITVLRCEKEPVRPDHMGVLWVWCVSDNVMYGWIMKAWFVVVG